MRKYLFIIIIAGLLFNGFKLQVQGQQTNVKLTLNEPFEDTKRIRSLGKERRGELVHEGSITVYMKHYMENGQQLLQLRVVPLLNTPEYRLLLFEKGGGFSDIALHIDRAYGQRPARGVNLADYIYQFYNTFPGVLELRQVSAYGFRMYESNIYDELVFVIDESSIPDNNKFSLVLSFYLGSQNHHGNDLTILSRFEELQYEIELMSFSSVLAGTERFDDRTSIQPPVPTPEQHIDAPSGAEEAAAQPVFAEQGTQFIIDKKEKVKEIYSKVNELRLNPQRIDGAKRQMLREDRAELERLKRGFDESFNGLPGDYRQRFKSGQEIFDYYYDFATLNFVHLNIEGSPETMISQGEPHAAQRTDRSFRIMTFILLILVILLAGFILFVRMRALRLKRKYTVQAKPQGVKKAASKGRQAKGAAARAKRLTI